MRTFSLVTVLMPADDLGISEDDATLDGVIVVTDDPAEMDSPCEGGDHNLGFIFLTTIDGCDCVINTCMPCTMDEVRQNIILRITPREQRDVDIEATLNSVT